MKLRTCRKCGEDKPLDQFSKNCAMLDGLLRQCKTCVNERQAAYRVTDQGREVAARGNKRYAERHPDEVRARGRRWVRENPDKVAERNRRRYERHGDKVRADARERYHQEPEKAEARRAVRNAIVSGELVRPETCEHCGGEGRDLPSGRTAIQAHHPDYSRPLDVEWLCTTCHADVHHLEGATA